VENIVVLLAKDNVRLFYVSYTTLNNIYAQMDQRSKCVRINVR
jgi:hypothetical protein